VVSQLVRCCDVSSKCQSAVEGKAIMPNPFLDASCPTASNEGGTGTHYVPLYTLQPAVGQHLYDRYSYLKKLIEEANGQEDTKKLLQFCSWENPTFSHAVLHELLWQIAIAYTHELRPYLDLLFHILMMQDSWQSIRIQKSLRGIPGNIFSQSLVEWSLQRMSKV
jgi:ubiquitin carboxyl-terminal hydrolase 9/24